MATVRRSPAGYGIEDLIASSHVVALPMRVRFRGITVREAMVFEGPAGWGEFGAFTEYDDAVAAPWLAAGIEAAVVGLGGSDFPVLLRDSVAINATVPAVSAADVPAVLDRFPGATTAKVKVAEPGGTLADDVARVEAVRALIPTVRVDANGGWSVEEAVTALRAITATGELQYAEQPCATVDELAAVRARVPTVRIAADESIRRAVDPLRVVRAGAADVAVVKVAPLGGVRAVAALAGELAEFGVPIVISSALDTAIGMSAGLIAAASLPLVDGQELASGLGTGALFERDIVDPSSIGRVPEMGRLAVSVVSPDLAALAAAAAPVDRRLWWHARARRVWQKLG